jgi:predicted phosphoribosyltransferase
VLERFRDRVEAGQRLATLLEPFRAEQPVIRQHRPRRLLFAAPVCACESAARLRDVADQVLCASPTDREVIAALHQSAGVQAAR